MTPLEELRQLIGRHAAPGAPATTSFGVHLVCTDKPSEIAHHVMQPMLAVVVQGAKRTFLGDRVFDYRAGQVLVASVDLPVSGHVCEASAEVPYLGAGLVLKPALIASMLLETAEHEHAAPADSLGVGVSAASEDLLDSLVRLLRLVERPRDVPVLAPMLEREVLWRLLNSGQGPMVRQIGLADSRLSQIGKAIRWIRMNATKPCPVEELAELAAMSASSFHRHFRAVTKMSPLQYQKTIRLQEARTRLMAESSDVAAVGFSVGYESASQFSREYRRLFGTPPGKDLARFRGASMAPSGVV